MAIRGSSPLARPLTKRSRATQRGRSVAFSCTIAAGLLGLLFATWPLPVLVVPDASLFVTWGMAGHGVGMLCVTAGYLIRRGLALAPLLPTGSGFLLLICWLQTGRLEAVAGLAAWPLALGVDLLPVLLIAAAAWLTVPRPQPRHGTATLAEPAADRPG
jgi:hypothetical protein